MNTESPTQTIIKAVETGGNITQWTEESFWNFTKLLYGGKKL